MVLLTNIVEPGDMRHLHRQLLTLKVDRTRYICRIKGLLASQGLAGHPAPEFAQRLAST